MGAGRQRWWNHGRYDDECRAADLGEPITGDLVAWWRRQWFVPLFTPQTPPRDSDAIEMRLRCYLPMCRFLHIVDGV